MELSIERQWVKHKFLCHRIHPSTETLIIGTFNPNVPENNANFFYSTGRNYLWTILPHAFSEESLRGTEKADKLAFIRKRHIDFIDLISEVEVDVGREGSRSDKYLDKRECVWRDVIAEIEQLHQLKRVCFTRRSFSDVPNICAQVDKNETYLRVRRPNVPFEKLISPARFYNAEKQLQWDKFLNTSQIPFSANRK